MLAVKFNAQATVFDSPKIELCTLDKKSRENEKECVKAVLCIVFLEYSLYSKCPVVYVLYMV